MRRTFGPTPQAQKVLNYLRNNTGLSTLDAWTVLGVLSPAKRIEELRNRGFDITTEWCKTQNGKRYGVYVLHESEGGEANV